MIKPLRLLGLAAALNSCATEQEDRSSGNLNQDQEAQDTQPSTNEDESSEITMKVSEDMSLRLTLAGLPHLNGQHYEGWIVVDEQPFSTGRFNINSLGGIDRVGPSGLAEEELTRKAIHKFDVDASEATAFVLTIEPNGDLDSAPSATHIVAGAFRDSVALAKVSHSSALANDFKNIAGSFILATPTNGPTTHNQGIWWLDPSSGPSATLKLPTLPQGWVYEGWVVDTSAETPNPITTGKFSATDVADSDGAGPSAGSADFPPFPGQDFINPARILNDGHHAAVITIEPNPDPDPAPFALKILKGVIAQDAGIAPTLHGMDAIFENGAISVKAEQL